MKGKRGLLPKAKKNAKNAKKKKSGTTAYHERRETRTKARVRVSGRRRHQRFSGERYGSADDLGHGQARHHGCSTPTPSGTSKTQRGEQRNCYYSTGRLSGRASFTPTARSCGPMPYLHRHYDTTRHKTHTHQNASRKACKPRPHQHPSYLYSIPTKNHHM